jgi:hypothetical protein
VLAKLACILPNIYGSPQSETKDQDAPLRRRENTLRDALERRDYHARFEKFRDVKSLMAPRFFENLRGKFGKR